MRQYIDFHMHTTLSDGAYSPTRLCVMAQTAGIGTLAITDHNYTEDLTELRATFPNLRLIQGAEISCLYTDCKGKETELHIVALGFDPHDPSMRSVLARNQTDRRFYVDAILDRLRAYDIDLGSYDTLCQIYPNSRHVGRMAIAKTMVERGYVSSIDEAFDKYIGAHGKRKAYVPNLIEYVSLEEAVSAVVNSGGVAVLAHLCYYLFNSNENHTLLRRFKDLTGQRGALEVFYARYNQEQCDVLKALADQYELMYSAASDFHGQNPNESLENRFISNNCAALLSALGVD